MKWIEKKPRIKYDEKDSLMEKVAKARGIKNIDRFLNPPKSSLNNPYLLENIDEAVEKIVKAIHNDRTIQVFADIDLDGVMSAGIMQNYLTSVANEENIREIAHSQRSLGHGIETGIDSMAIKYDGHRVLVDEDVDLLIIVDSSSNSIEGLKYLKEKGVEIVVIDHHIIEARNKFNDYATVVNCQDGSYPNKSLSGSAMVYKVCKVLDDYLGVEIADHFLDMSAIGLIGDMMDLKNRENRKLVLMGLENIRNLGLSSLFQLLKVDVNELSATDIGFKLSPAVNSCTRYDKIELALKLVTTPDVEESFEIAKEMIELNAVRKSEEKDIVESAKDRAVTDNKIGYLCDNEISSGFRGLISMQLAQQYGRPFLTFMKIEKKDKTVFAGSARSVGQLPLKEMLEDTELFNYCRGHSQSFGFEIDEDKFDEAIDILNKEITEEDIKMVHYYDVEIDANDIDFFEVKEVEKFNKVTGKGFPPATFRVKNLSYDSRKVLGKNKDTVKIMCEQDLDLIKFKVDSNYALDMEEKSEEDIFGENNFEAVGKLNINKFYNWGQKKEIVTIQLMLDDYRMQK